MKTLPIKSLVHTPNSPLAKSIMAIIRRIECPLAPAATQARTATFGRRHFGKTAYRTGTVKDRTLSDADKADIAQQAMATIVKVCNETGNFSALCPFRGAEILKGEIPIINIFRQCRKMLNINGGTHDRARIDSLDELEKTGIELAAPTSSEAAIARLEALREIMEESALSSYKADKSRKRKYAYEHALKIIAHLCGDATDLIFESPESRKKTFLRFRSYLSIPCKGSAQAEREKLAQSIAQAMTKLA